MDTYPQKEHDAIVDQLRRSGWEKWEAEDEADRLMHDRIIRISALAKARGEA